MCGGCKNPKIYVNNSVEIHVFEHATSGDTDMSYNDDNDNNSDTTAAEYAASASLRLPEF
jgi:hypothetical protein